ncbi:bifunctional adenosylcobalamin biosynthesis protein CobU [Gottschalkia purinilytica]|uniref:Adenosylcobinamide kinase n=1 Tax=Gottschalkia purinilytica TaxID=1503 RepID=A0A0L0W8X0_GOTPU|nr:bifunctional adenosylcobinamide kinase/adenosylcobinamide-phosphate guanylyltransferase [Gottschalkia purinilytica]KNF07901.1 bifunctional adenosylcobalamin biosynthesis protein CobU [Gottschalkia purinilytica]
MSKVILITGGARSGKSTLGENKAKELGKNIVYIATSIAFDDGMKDRIKKHKESRPSHWATIEKYKDFSNIVEDEAFLQSDLILLDCMTLMISNLLLESNIDFDNCKIEEIDNIEKKIFEEVNTLLEVINKYNKNIIIVTNEVGMGIVPSYKLGSIFRDIAGRINQYLASKAEEVYITISGIPMKIK